MLKHTMLSAPSIAAMTTISVSAQSTDPLTPTMITAEAPVKAVTLYIGRAAVTRTWTGALEVGLYELSFADLPRSADGGRLQAKATGGVKVLGVDYTGEYVETPPAGPIVEITKRIETVEREMIDLDRQSSLLSAREGFVNSVSVRARQEAKDKSGTAELDMDAVREQLAFISAEQEEISLARRDLAYQSEALEKELELLHMEAERLGWDVEDYTWRSEATVSIAVTKAGPAEVSLVYLVDEAAWAPAYNFRKPVGDGKIDVEYDALLAQNTGEDWNDAVLTLSTAQPTVAANPPSLSPWYVDIARKEEAQADKRVASQRPAPGPGGGGGGGGGSIFGDAGDDPDGAAVAALAASARVSAGATSITFTLPRTVTIPSDSEQQQRTRIASFPMAAEYRHVATPVLTEAVYVRGDLTNDSAYQLLPGHASIFVGPDYVGPTRIGSVAPGGVFELFFGIDRSVSVNRTLVRKHTEKTGMFSGGRRTSYDYRIEIENAGGNAITLELWDRRPVSRSEDIEVNTQNIKPALATDAEYVAEDKPRGLLQWLINVPAKRTGANAVIVTWGMRVSRSKDTEMTGLPE
jgi:uncharacterized protein (TIGR02231 family)